MQPFGCVHGLALLLLGNFGCCMAISRALQAELEMYDPELMLRAAAVVANKIDLEGVCV